ncbi:hypothetical protein GALMADRAFT_1244311 [Galerina marginata CBS 339.88]|uniref:Uncharacterized protein n=1 Tax=Galerina marginata (strain CBS 339.88) TaxID=685588 RepID=A0A067T8U2_GALM3|nr:hypothetical protein GALMADRAFT_1244311 [Galerina marginata CBS 339.88]
MQFYGNYFGHDLFQLGKPQLVLDRDKLSLSREIHWPEEYRQFILEFLEDPNRSGVYALNSQRYTTAAVYFLKHISNYSEQMLLLYDTPGRKFKRQINLPWLWRKLVHQAPSSEAARILKWQLKRQSRPAIYRLYQSQRVFRLALRGLVHVLPKSDISEELTALARRQKFGLFSRKATRRIRTVTREIARYLAGVDAEHQLAE